MLIRYSQAAYVALLLFCVLLLLRHKKPVARLDQANDDLLVASGPSLVQELESREPEAAQHWASPGPAFEATPSPVPSHKPGASPEDAPNGTVPHPRPNVAPDAVAPPPSAPEGPREAVPDTPPEAAPSVGPHGAQVAVAAALRADAAANAGASNAWLRVREIPRLLGAAEAARLRARGVVVGVHVFGHNPNFVVAVNGTLRFVSRLILAHHVKRRGDHWIGTMHAAWVADCLQWAEAAIGAPIPRVDVLVSEFGPAPYNASRLLRGVKVRRTVDPGYNRHILAHGETGFYASPFRSALVVAVHGSGYDGVHNVYLAERWNGSWTELWAEPNDPTFPGGRRQTNRPFNSPCVLLTKQCKVLRLPDLQKCTLAAERGRPDPKVVRHFHDVYAVRTKQLQDPTKSDLFTSVADWAAAAHAFFVEHVTAPLRHYPRLVEAVDGIVVSGGGAFNRALNTAVRTRFGKPVFVPAIVGDDNLAIGYVADLLRPPQPQVLNFLGLPLAADGPRASGRAVSPADVARLLVDGAAIAVLRGRAEPGPYSLGHRTVFVHPSSAHASRFVSDGAAPHVVLAEADAPDLLKPPRPPAETAFLHHRLSASVRQQSSFWGAQRTKDLVVGLTVTPASDAWMADVLQGVRAAGGVPLLLYQHVVVTCTCSATGPDVQWPVVPNSLDEALQFFSHNPHVSHLLFDQWLYARDALNALQPHAKPFDRQGFRFSPTWK